MPEAGDLSQQIVVDQSYKPAKPPSRVDRFMGWVAQRKIKTFEPQLLRDEQAFPDILEQIRLIPEAELQRIEDSLPDIARQFTDLDEQVARMSVSVELNQSSAILFAQTLRGRVGDFITTDEAVDYSSGNWLTARDLYRLADRWHLPFVVLVEGGPHFRLALKAPEQTPQGWRVLVYDPLINGERWQHLRGWTSDYSDPLRIFEYASFSSEGLRALREGIYDLSLMGDAELAEGAMQAKQARVQFNAVDCGPMCLYAAALRSAAKPGQNAFKFMGRENLRQDLGLSVKTREEILGR